MSPEERESSRAARDVCNLEKESFFLGEFFSVTTQFDYEQRTIAFAILGVNPAP
jgi:hypothetical protein